MLGRRQCAPDKLTLICHWSERTRRVNSFPAEINPPNFYVVVRNERRIKHWPFPLPFAFTFCIWFGKIVCRFYSSLLRLKINVPIEFSGWLSTLLVLNRFILNCFAILTFEIVTANFVLIYCMYVRLSMSDA